MVGSGWLFNAQLNAKIAGNYAFLSWILAAAIVMSVGLCLSQVVSVYPIRGVTTRSSALSHNGVFGMPFAFANWFGLMVTVGTEAQATTQYLSATTTKQILMNSHGLTYPGKLLAIVILFVYFIINFYGIKLLARVNNIITVFKIFTPIFAIILLLITSFDTHNFHLASNIGYSSGSAITAIVASGLIYSYNGFQLSTAFASEVHNPKRNIPISMILSIIIVMIVYMLLQLSFMGAIPHNLLLNNGGWAGLNFHSPLMNLALLLNLNFLGIILVADSIISPSGTGYSFLGAASRMFYAMAKEGQMPKFTITKLHHIYNICRRSLFINFLLTAIFLWQSDSWASLMVIVTGYHLIGYMAAPISMGAIKNTFKTRTFGLVVFCILGTIMITIPLNEFFKMNISILIIMFIYGIIQLLHKVKLSTLLYLSTPINILLWLIYFFQNIYFVIILSAVFYLIVTSRKYVLFCKNNRRHVIETDTDDAEFTPHC